MNSSCTVFQRCWGARGNGSRKRSRTASRHRPPDRPVAHARRDSPACRPACDAPGARTSSQSSGSSEPTGGLDDLSASCRAWTGSWRAGASMCGKSGKHAPASARACKDRRWPVHVMHDGAMVCFEDQQLAVARFRAIDHHIIQADARGSSRPAPRHGGRRNPYRRRCMNAASSARLATLTAMSALRYQTFHSSAIAIWQA